MNVEITESCVESLIDTLNVLICDDRLLTREQRENMVRTVAILGGLGERFRQTLTEKDAKKMSRAEKQPKIPRDPDPDFPRSGQKWIQEDLDLIHSVIDDLPDAEIDNHVIWLSGQQKRTPYAIALKIAGEGRLDKEWAKKWKPVAKEIRGQNMQMDEGLNE